MPTNADIPRPKSGRQPSTSEVEEGAAEQVAQPGQGGPTPTGDGPGLLRDAGTTVRACGARLYAGPPEGTNVGPLPEPLRVDLAARPHYTGPPAELAAHRERWAQEAKEAEDAQGDTTTLPEEDPAPGGGGEAA